MKMNARVIMHRARWHFHGALPFSDEEGEEALVPPSLLELPPSLCELRLPFLFIVQYRVALLLLGEVKGGPTGFRAQNPLRAGSKNER